MDLPKMITFELTHRCNCRCEMCRFWVKESARVDSDELNFNQIKEVVFNIKKTYDKEGKKLEFGLTGAEPLLRNDFNRIISFFKDHKIGYDIVTNFSLLGKETMNAFVDNPPKILNVSLDGFGEVHNLVRGAKIFDKIVENLKIFRKLCPEIPIKINSTINKRNLKTLDKLFYFAIDNEFDLNFQHLNFITPEIFTKQKEFEKKHFGKIFSHEPTFYTLNKQEVYILANKISLIRRLAQKRKYEISFLPEIKKSIFDWYLNPHKIIIDVRCDINRLRIKPDGRLVHCENYSYGNLLQEEFENLLNSDQSFTFREIINKKIMPFCNRCCLRFKDYIET